MKVIGFNAGQFGDLIMNTVVSERFKNFYPQSKLILGVGPQYSEIIPLFYQHPHIDSFHIYETYDGWPSKKDLTYLNKNNFNIIYNAFPQHTEDEWWKKRHQTQEACLMNGLPDCEPTQCILNKWFYTETNSQMVAFAPFAGFYNQNNDKKLTLERAQDIVNFLIKMGYSVLQIGGEKEPKLENTIKKNTSYFESIKDILSCRFYIGTDTGATWAVSSYSMPSIGLYSHSYYGNEYIKNIQPINPNGLYLSSQNVNDIKIEEIKNKIHELIN